MVSPNYSLLPVSMETIPRIPISYSGIHHQTISHTTRTSSIVSARPSSTPASRPSTHAYCTPNIDPNMCAMGVGIRNPTQLYNEVSQETEIDISFWVSKCNALGEPVNFTMTNRLPLAGVYLPFHGNVTISAKLPPASYEHCHDEPGIDADAYVTCQSQGWAEFPCGCTDAELASNGDICEPTVYDKCVLKPGFLEFNSTSSEGMFTEYQSVLSVTTTANIENACNCDKKYFNNCPAEYVFCCGCEFLCDA